MPAEFEQEDVEKGSPADRQQRFWRPRRQRTEPCAEAAAQNCRLADHPLTVAVAVAVAPVLDLAVTR